MEIQALREKKLQTQVAVIGGGLAGMLAAIAAAKAAAPVTVRGTEALNKSWPEFVSVYRQLGGKAE